MCDRSGKEIRESSQISLFSNVAKNPVDIPSSLDSQPAALRPALPSFLDMRRVVKSVAQLT